MLMSTIRTIEDVIAVKLQIDNELNVLIAGMTVQFLATASAHLFVLLNLKNTSRKQGRENSFKRSLRTGFIMKANDLIIA
jgi:hypothetical protein